MDEKINAHILRSGDGRFAGGTADAIYAEIKRIDQLRLTDQTAVAAALSAAEKSTAAALASSEKAIDKAEGAQLRTNESQNEFRQQLKDQATTLMPRSEAENTTRELRGLLSEMREDIGTLRSRIDVGPATLPLLISGSDRRAGASEAVAQGWKYILAIGSLIIGLAGLALALSQLNP